MISNYTVIVAGGRDFIDKQFVFKMLDQFHKAYKITKVLDGQQRGVDGFANAWARSRGIDFKRFPAEWDKYGRSAGPRRNQQMLDEKPNALIVFPGRNGTGRMVEQATKFGLEDIYHITYRMVDIS